MENAVLEKEQVLAPQKRRNLREELKEIMRAELKNLPRLLEEMAPEQRVNAIIKIMPHILPPMEKQGGGLDDWEIEW